MLHHSGRAAPGPTDYAPLPVFPSSRPVGDETQSGVADETRADSSNSHKASQPQLEISLDIAGTLDDVCAPSGGGRALPRTTTVQYNLPRWFDPAAGGPGRVVRFLERPCMMQVLHAIIVAGAASFSSVFFLAASCDASSRMVQVLAGVGVLIFAAGVLAAYHSLLPIVHWEEDDQEETQAGILQQLYSASDDNISKKQRERLSAWRYTCTALFVATLAYFILVGVACIELFLRHRNEPDRLSIVGASLHTIMPEPSCLSAEDEHLLLGLLLCMYVPMGVVVALLGAGMLLVVGLGAELAADQIHVLRQAIATDKDTWPWVTKDEDLRKHPSASSDLDIDDEEVFERVGAAGKNRREVIRMFRRIKRDGFAALRSQKPIAGIREHHVEEIKRLCDEFEPAAEDGSTVPDCLVQEVMKRLGYRLIMSTRMMLVDENAWEAEVRRPIVLLASKILPLLSNFSGCITALFISVWSVSLAMLPVATATHNVICMYLVMFFPTPLLVLVPLAVVGTSCDDLLDDLNELRCHKLTVEQASRVDTIRNYLKDTNHGQGLGFEIFGVIMDKKKLIRITGIMVSGFTSVFAALAHLGEDRGDGSGSTLCTC